MMSTKQRLLQIIGQQKTPQTQAYLPMLQMAISAMSDEDIIEMLRYIRGLADELLKDES